MALIEKGNFILEYRGELISSKESVERQKKYTKIQNGFLFDFEWNEKLWWYVNSYLTIS